MLTDPSDGFMQFFDGEITDYDNPKFLELYNKALATTDIEARKAVYKELYQLFNDELPIIFTSYKRQYTPITDVLRISRSARSSVLLAVCQLGA